jgi:DNA-binding Xre family transcriptional regulator
MTKSIVSKVLMEKNENTTCGKFLKSLTPKQKKRFEQEHKEFLISEMLLAAMEQDNVSVRELAKLAGVSPAIVQGIRSGTKKNITVKTFSKLMKTFGFSLAITKNDLVLPINTTKL